MNFLRFLLLARVALATVKSATLPNCETVNADGKNCDKCNQGFGKITETQNQPANNLLLKR